MSLEELRMEYRRLANLTNSKIQEDCVERYDEDILNIKIKYLTGLLNGNL